MTHRLSLTLFTLTFLALLPGPGQAATSAEQGFIPGGKLRAPCAMGGVMVRGMIGADTSAPEAAAAGLGLCANDAPSAFSLVAGGGSSGPVTVTPGLQIRVLAIKPTTSGPALTAGPPGVIYASGDSAALVISHNTPGYLEVLSVDQGRTRLVEGVLLITKAGFVTLADLAPSGLRIRFLPCKPPVGAAIEAAPHTYAAELSGSQALAVDWTLKGLPTCPATVDTKVVNDALFKDPIVITPAYSADSALYTAVTIGRSLQTDIVFKHP